METQKIKKDTEKMITTVAEEMQVKAIMRNSSDCQKLVGRFGYQQAGRTLVILYVVYRTINWCNHFREQLEIGNVGNGDTLTQ